jgi:uncharacterized membrane protein
MLLIKQILLIVFYLFSPLLVLHLCHKYRFVNKLGAVVIAYVLGLILANIGILPDGSGEIQEVITMVVVPLAIPLMLFSSNLRDVSHLAKQTFVSLAIGVFSVTAVIITGFFLLEGKMDDLWKIAGMLVGVYTGGTPNLASLKLMLDVDDTQYIITHTADLAIGAIYFIFLITAGQRFFSLFLITTKKETVDGEEFSDLDGKDPYWGMLKKRVYRPLLKAFGISVLIVAISAGVSFLFSKSVQVSVIMLLITSLGIGASFINKVNKIEKSFELGMYLVLIFSVVVASMVSIPELINGSPTLLYYVAIVIFGSLFLQVILSKIFKIDTDTVIITSTALICSPPFVPVVAGALGNRKIVLPGLTVGIIGYAIGNYLGFMLAQILRSI